MFVASVTSSLSTTLTWPRSSIEAIGLVDHFQFLEKYSNKAAGKKTQATDPRTEAARQKAYLGTDSNWAAAYFNKNDLHFLDREVFF